MEVVGRSKLSGHGPFVRGVFCGMWGLAGVGKGEVSTALKERDKGEGLVCWCVVDTEKCSVGERERREGDDEGMDRRGRGGCLGRENDK